MKHILWVSRHPPTTELLTKLSEIFDDQIVVTRHDNPIDAHEDLVKLYRKGGYDDLVVTLPMEMIGRICAAGIYPIKAVHMADGFNPDTKVRQYKFLRFERIFSVTIEKERLDLNKIRRKNARKK